MKDKSTNSSHVKSKDWTEKSVNKLVEYISQNRKDLGAVHQFVDEELWKVLDYRTLQEYTDEHLETPGYEQMRRIYKAVEFQKEYLPKLGVPYIREGVLRAICSSKYSDQVKTRVAQKIQKSANPRKLDNSDIEIFIKNSKVVLKPVHKEAAADFAANMVTDNFLDELNDYFINQGFKSGREKAFLKYLSVEIRKEIASQL